MLDESMLGWRPKTSKRGGLPHILFEPCKPVPLGLMIGNAMECTAGIYINHNLVDGVAYQWQRKYFVSPVESHLQQIELEFITLQRYSGNTSNRT